ncbi:hypothetical protein F5Y15DRAFT_415478 [Xylariaceae sp. FL0016]|nr:hypothetical protein F5Y15DRAFT_415478 [Xylariaceae sp. FL0016]
MKEGMVGDAPPFLQLPCELFELASSYLSADDLFSLRLTCHHIEASLFKSFCLEFFADRRFMVTFDSLKCLIEITKSPRFSGCLQRLTIGLDRLNSSAALPRFRELWDPATRTVRDASTGTGGVDVHRLEIFAVEQSFLISSGQLQLMLAEALGNIRRLEELRLQDRLSLKATRRPTSNPRLVSYGASQVFRETGIDFKGQESHLHHNDEQFVDMVFSAVLLALARKRTQLKTLTVCIQEAGIGLSSTAFMLPMFVFRDLEETLFNLRSVDLSVSFIQVPLGRKTSSRSLEFLPWQEHQLFAFLEQTPNLTSLKIRSKEQGYVPDGIIKWLARTLAPEQQEEQHNTGPVTEAVVETASTTPPSPGLSMLQLSNRKFAELRTLAIANMTAKTAILSRVLLYLAPTLRQLDLTKVALKIKPLDHELDNNPDQPNAWSSLFRTMGGSLDLEELVASALEHHTTNCSRESRGHPVAFLRSDMGVQSGPSSGILNAWRVSGDAGTMRSLLKEMSEKTIILCEKCKRINPGYHCVKDVLDL